MRVEPSFKMININPKRPTNRRAIAQGEITVSSKTFELIKNKKLPKGCPVTLSEVAGILSAKNAASHIPLCHPLSLDAVSINTELDDKTQTIRVYCTVQAFAKTGVEMEALAGVNGALLTIYDLAKNVDPVISMGNIKLLVKEGGKSGVWTHPDGVPDSILKSLGISQNPNFLSDLTASILTVSDRASQGVYDDLSGQKLNELLKANGATIQSQQLVPDEKNTISGEIKEIVQSHRPNILLVTGGTGIGPRDVTPEAVSAICDKLVPGIGEFLRLDGTKYKKSAILSRSIAGILDDTFIITLPGSPSAVEEGFLALQDVLKHAVKMLKGASCDNL